MDVGVANRGVFWGGEGICLEGPGKTTSDLNEDEL